MPEYRDIDHLLRDFPLKTLPPHEPIIQGTEIFVLPLDDENLSIRIIAEETPISGRVKGKVIAGVHLVPEKRKIIENELVEFSESKIVIPARSE